ncbi:MAG: GH1 family beta-glucosidase [Pleomorphochaeta sp.]
MTFKKDFMWGAATASYQIEGSTNIDGRGYTIWDDFCSKPGKVLNGDSGEIASDSYNRNKEDVSIMKQLGLKAYRFSIAWSRIIPNGYGAINPAGLEYYRDFIDLLIENNIEPVVTLYHWDLPYELFKIGGWQNPNISDYFVEYVKEFVSFMGQRVKYYITFNEPQCFIGLGHVTGVHAPGTICSRKTVLEMAHNVLLSHGKAVKAIRELGNEFKVGYAPTSSVYYPATDKKEDIEAAKKAYFDIDTNQENYIWNVSWWSDPIILGKYPKKGLEIFKEDLPNINQEDMDTICQPLDFYCQNIYNGKAVISDNNGSYKVIEAKKGSPLTSCAWPVTPQVLYWGPKFLYERYKLPIIISENGMAAHDWISIDGKVHDPNRIDFVHRYLIELKKAYEEGIDIKGYFLWSLLDNFEWEKGYSQRFGIVYVDYETQKRIIKDSGFWYKSVITSNGEFL